MKNMKISARHCSGIITLEGTVLEVPQIPWTEYAGKIVDVTDNSLIIEFRQHISIPVSTGVLRKSVSTIPKGADVGILVLDDGSIRVRRAA